MLQAIAGHDPKDPASANGPIPGYRAALTGDVRGLRIGIVRLLYEDDMTVAPEVRAGLEEAYAVFRSLGAVLEDVHIRPAADYYAVKITIAESEQYAIHEEELRASPGDFGADFLGRALPAVLYSGTDYVQAQRERRLMLAEMAPIYQKFDVLVTPAAPVPAPRLGTWRTVASWQNSSLTTPFNVTGGPALAQCMGFTSAGLPLSLQLVGRPFDEATVLQPRLPTRRRRTGAAAGLISIRQRLSRADRRRPSGQSRLVTRPYATLLWPPAAAPNCHWTTARST